MSNNNEPARRGASMGANVVAGSGNKPSNVGLAELVAINDEIVALVRAGVPLGPGLTSMSGDLSSRLGKIAAQIGQRLDQGAPLDDAVSAEQAGMPPVYAALVRAGLRSGNLAAALEGLSETSRRVLDLRRTVRAALIYPAIVATLAYGLFIFSMAKLQPQFMPSYDELDISSNWAVQCLGWASANVATWWPLPLIAATLGGAALWATSRRMLTNTSSSTNTRWPARISPLWRMLHESRQAVFADMLALLIEHSSPLTEAILLAAATTGDRRWERECGRLVDRIRGGRITPSLASEYASLLTWTIADARSPLRLSRLLRGHADIARRRANRLAEWHRIYLPIILTVVIGGGAVALYSLSMLGPWFHMLDILSNV